ncbi:glycoside hydrolase family 26 protein [Anaeropeptidivorans aminofermentans]|jgi:hypothetical protein|uniref:hypothetical protein n=1 Tax=Anaeropeptidivorans aminofermentans TaxID=2934315 RepID=UPI00202447D5|nr:hypothetical protein [Anaeropeptidivorans aminofermentans]
MQLFIAAYEREAGGTMSRIKPFLIIFVIMLLSACVRTGEPENTPEITEEAVEVSTIQKTEPEAMLAIYYEKEMETALYEPEEGCYLGAYILSDKAVDFDIKKFESLTEANHSLYSYYTKLSSPLPTEWILSCIANMKTPNIFVYPDSIENPYDYAKLESAAKKFGEFYVPMFVHLYPLTEDMPYDPENYRDFYQRAKDIFEEHASNVAFVWTVSEKNLPLINNYYPGDDSVDWVGISIKKSAHKDKGIDMNILPKIDYFYNTFQDRKPVMVSELAISHFSSENHAYYSKEAGDALKEVYNAVISDYPRIKAINYMSYNGLEPVNQTPGTDNFSITDNETMLQYYKEAAGNTGFIKAVDFSAGGDKFMGKVKAFQEGAYYQGEAYLPENFILEVFNADPKGEAEYKLFNDEKYFSLKDIAKAKSNFDYKNKKIDINNINKE